MCKSLVRFWKIDYPNYKLVIADVNVYFKPLFDLIPTNFYITGGSVLDVVKERMSLNLKNEQYKTSEPSAFYHNDIDIFFTSKEERNKTLRSMKSLGYTLIRGDKNRSYWKNNNKKFDSIASNTLNIVHTIFKSPKNIIESFDFTVCTGIINREGGFYAAGLYFRDIIKNIIRLNNRHKQKIDKTNAEIYARRIFKYSHSKGMNISTDLLYDILSATYDNKVLLYDDYSLLNSRKSVRKPTPAPEQTSLGQNLVLPF